MNNILFKHFLNDESCDENICLICNDVLDNNNITLDCGHKFNYIPLYNEVVYQKTKRILDNSKLKLNEIKCPYCRQITNKLLPFYKYYNVKQLIGVNSPYDLCIENFKCQYIDKKKQTCNNSACITDFGVFCNKHLKYNKNDEETLKNIKNEDFTKYSKFKLNELKKILKTYNAKLGGNKNELINRILIIEYNNKLIN